MVIIYTMHYLLAKMAIGIVLGSSMAAASTILPARTPEPITISPADFNIAKSEALEQLAELEALAAVSVATADYARLYREFQDNIARVRPKLSEWSQSERNRVENLKQPNDAAWSALQIEEQNAQARIARQGQEAQQDYAIRQEQQREQRRLNSEQNLAEQQARLQEAQIRESEARTDYYEDNWNSWYNPWWYSHPGGPIHRRRHRLYDPSKPPVKPLVPNNYDPVPITRHGHR